MRTWGKDILVFLMLFLPFFRFVMFSREKASKNRKVGQSAQTSSGHCQTLSVSVVTGRPICQIKQPLTFN